MVNILDQAELVLGAGTPGWNALNDLSTGGRLYAMAVSGADLYPVGRKAPSFRAGI